MIHNTQSAQISQKRDGHNIYVIMKTMCPHHNVFVATHAIGHVMYFTHNVHTQKLNKTNKQTHKKQSKKEMLQKNKLHNVIWHLLVNLYIYNIYDNG